MQIWHQVKEKAAVQYWASKGDRMRKPSQGTKTQGWGVAQERTCRQNVQFIPLQMIFRRALATGEDCTEMYV